jgi:lipid-A-disaccharide synthase
MKTIMIVTGESSGELYGSLLAKELKTRYPDLHLVGIGGERMRMAGVELISGISGAFGISEVFSALRDLRSAIKRTKETIKELMPDVLVLIDFPDFNIKVAGFAKACKIKILYYVSPQVWAWRKGRVKKIAGLVDRMAVILPFEEDIYRRAGLQCEFVGHPIVEEIEDVLKSSVNSHSSLEKPTEQCPVTSERSASPSLAKLSPKLRTYFRDALGFYPNRPLLSLLPGSRPHELKRLFPLMIEVIREFKRDPEINSIKDYQFCVPLAPNINYEKYKQYLDTLIQEGAIIKRDETINVLTASDMAVIASGTATLQAAFLEVPMVAIYKLSPFSYFFGRLFINVKHICLVNILSGREVVPELLQQKANPENIIEKLKKIKFDVGYREGMINQFKKLKEPFLGLKASNRVTGIIAEMAGWVQ